MSWRDGVRQVALDAGLTRPSELVILSGAGISQEHPTHAPSGVDLMKAAIESFFLSETLDEMHETYEGIRRVTGQPESTFWGRPRLEAVLDVVSNVYGTRALGHLTPYFTGRPSNRVHAMLAAHLAQGGPQITANFDRFIEHVAAPGSQVIHHFHGEVESPADTLPLGARLGAIEHGLETAERARLLRPLTDPRTRSVAFIGYSFSDYFDVTPAIVDAIQHGALDEKTLIWFDFDHTLPEPQATTLVTGPGDPRDVEIVGAALARGVRVVTIRGWSGDALFVLLEGIGCRLDAGWALAEQCDRSHIENPPASTNGREQRKAATVLLLHRFGMLGRIPSRRLDLGVDDIPSTLLADYWWKKGRYSLARESALAALESNHVHSDIGESLVHARFDWIEGRLRSARRHVLYAIGAMDAEPDAPLALRAEALERYGRVAVHIRRTPDARLVLLPGLLRGLPDYERCAERLLDSRDLDGDAASHLRDALSNFRSEVLEGRSAVADEATARQRAGVVERFSQSESIGSYVDYIRGNANIGAWDFPTPNGDWREPMNALYDVVGNVADKHRLTLLQPPGLRRRWFNPLEAARALDASWYHRLRMVARYGLMRLSRTVQEWT